MWTARRRRLTWASPLGVRRCTDQIRKYFTQGADFKGGQGGEYYSE